MRRKYLLFLLAYLIPFSTASAYPQATDNFVYDFAEILDDERALKLNRKLRQLEVDTGIEIAVVTLVDYGSYNTGAASWEEFATGFFNAWGIGNLPENNGILFLVSTNDRKIRIELGKGYSSSYDKKAGSVVAMMSPYFKSGDFTTGLELGVDEIIAIATTNSIPSDSIWQYILIGFVVISVGAAFYAKNTKNEGLFWAILGVVGLVIILLVRLIWKQIEASNSAGGSGGFGGGSSGGGGASGSF